MTIPRYAGNQFAARGALKKLRAAGVITDTATDDQAFSLATAYAKLRDAGMADTDALVTMALPPIQGELPTLDRVREIKY